jgi:hypothetical protein
MKGRHAYRFINGAEWHRPEIVILADHDVVSRRVGPELRRTATELGDHAAACGSPNRRAPRLRRGTRRRRTGERYFGDFGNFAASRPRNIDR